MSSVVTSVTTAMWILIELIQFAYMAYLMWRDKEMLLIGIISALGLLLLALKAGGRKTIGNDIFVDVLITVTLMVCFYGTFSGMTAAMVGGLTASIILFVLKKTMVHEN
jgi:hypothetical protein